MLRFSFFFKFHNGCDGLITFCFHLNTRCVVIPSDDSFQTKLHSLYVSNAELHSLYVVNAELSFYVWIKAKSSSTMFVWTNFCINRESILGHSIASFLLIQLSLHFCFRSSHQTVVSHYFYAENYHTIKAI